jgi:hypothetical protein
VPVPRRRITLAHPRFPGRCTSPQERVRHWSRFASLRALRRQSWCCDRADSSGQ